MLLHVKVVLSLGLLRTLITNRSMSMHVMVPEDKSIFPLSSCQRRIGQPQVRFNYRLLLGTSYGEKLFILILILQFVTLND